MRFSPEARFSLALPAKELPLSRRNQRPRLEVSLSLQLSLPQRKETKENKGETNRKLKSEVSLSLNRNFQKLLPPAKGSCLRMPWS